MTRIQLDMNDELVKELDELVKETNLATRKELFNNALTIFQWAVRSRKAGLIVAALNEDKGVAKELVMPALEAVKPVTDRKALLSK